MTKPVQPAPTKPAPTTTTPPTPAKPDAPKKPKLSMDIDEVDVSESLERKISA